MDGGVEAGIDEVVPKLVDLFEMFSYDVTAEQVLEAFAEAGLTVVSLEDYEDYQHGE